LTARKLRDAISSPIRVTELFGILRVRGGEECKTKTLEN